MSAQTSSALVSPARSSDQPISVWTPADVAVVSIFLGFPAGVALGSINCVRIGQPWKAILYLLAELVGLALLVVVRLAIPGNLYYLIMQPSSLVIPGDLSYLIMLPISLALSWYLWRQTKADLEAFQAAGGAIWGAGMLGGCLIGLGALVLTSILVAALTLVVILVLTFLASP